MERYSEYKDSGVKWLGEIPSHWEVMPIKHSYKFTVGWTPPTGRNDLFEGNNLWANISDLGKKEINNTANRISDSAVRLSGRSMSPKGSLLYSFKLSVGTVSFCGADMYTNEAIATFLKGKNSLEYLYYAAPIFIIKNANTNIYGAPILNQDLIKNALVLLPPRTEQDAIVRYLDAATSKIDKAIAMQQKMIDLLNERKQIIIQNAVTKGLDENMEMKDSGDRWIGLFPSSWTTRRLNFSSWIRARLGWKGLKASEYVDNGYPFLSAFNIVNDKIKWENLNFINKYRYDESPEIKLSVGDILLVKDGAGIGKCARIDELPCGESTANGSLAVITANYFVDYRYLYYFMISKSFKDHTELLINGMGVPHFTQGEMKKIVIPIPPKSEQQAIVAYLDKQMQRFDSAITNCQRQITLLQERKQIIINEVVTGKVKVS